MPGRCSKTTTSGGSRTSSSTWRSTARATSRSRTSSPSCSRSACASVRTSTPTRASTRRSTAADSDGQPAVIERSLLILEDWAHAVSFDSDGDRQGARRHPGGVADRARRRRAACSTCSCPCCSRTRATPSDCRSASRRSSARFPDDRLKKFYTDWYRPDLMAVIAVGDFDPRGDRNAHQVALRLDSRAGHPVRDRSTTCRISRHAILGRDGPRSDRHHGERLPA